MMLLNQVISFNSECIIVEYTPQSQAWYVDAQGNMPAWIGIELMAQAIAVHAGLLKHNENINPKQGVLLGTRSYVAKTPSFEANVRLYIKSILVFRDESGLGAYDCSISNDNNEALATATLKVFEPADFQSFLQGAPQ
ncbi:MAG TPA: hypothetical protein VGC12_01015 [Methyloradius sp.]